MNNLIRWGVDSIRSRLVGALGGMEDGSKASQMQSRYTFLNEHSRLKLLLSAELGAILRCHDIGIHQPHLGPEEYQSLEDCIERTEIAQMLGGNASDRAIGSEAAVRRAQHSFYTPFGDEQISVEDGHCSVSRTPKVGITISVDFRSKIATSFEHRSGVLSQKYLEVSHAEESLIVEKLNSALELIDEVAPIYGALVRNFNRRIIIRKSLQDLCDLPRGLKPLSSEHTLAHPGTIRLLNPHLEVFTTEGAVEALLHESLHCMLAMFEFSRASKLVENVDEFRPVSAWSGNAIPNSSLGHAVFVYYLLLRFFVEWHAQSPRGEERCATISRRIAHFSAGFLSRGNVHERFTAHESLPLELVEVTQALQGRAKEIIAHHGGRACSPSRL